MPTAKEIKDLKQKLDDRFYQLREEIRLELLKSDDQQFIDLAGRVHDREEESVADMLVDLQLSSIDRHIQEVRDIDAALIRIAEGSYGICLDCEDPISFDRLAVHPTAKRCSKCQTEHESRPAQTGTPSL